MKNKYSSLEELIKDAVQEDYEKAPEPPKSKAEIWEEINKQLPKREKRREVSWKKKTIAVAASLVIAICIGFSQSNKTMAFEWFTNLFFNVNENEASISGSIGTQPSDESPPTVPSEEEFEIIEVETREEIMSLNEAQNITDFEILVPGKVPNEFGDLSVTVSFSNDQVDDRVVLQYDYNQETFTITEQYVRGQMGYGISVDLDDTNVEEIMINGKKGILFSFKNGEKKLTLDLNNYHIELNGKVSAEQMVEIAESL